MAQVFELEPGLSSGRVWREVALLRRCIHPRIVPVLGVAIQVSVMRCGSGSGDGCCCYRCCWGGWPAWLAAWQSMRRNMCCVGAHV